MAVVTECQGMFAGYARATVLYDQRRYALAVTELLRDLAHNPDSMMHQVLLSRCLTMLEDHQGAKAAGEAAVRAAPESAEAHEALAWALFRADEAAPALEAINEARRLDPEDADLHSLAALVLAEQNTFAAALDAVRTGLELDPESRSCLRAQATVLNQAEQYLEAQAVGQHALGLEPLDAQLHTEIGWSLLGQGRRAAAEDRFIEALAIEPNAADARWGLLEARRSRLLLYSWWRRRGRQQLEFAGDALMAELDRAAKTLFAIDPTQPAPRRAKPRELAKVDAALQGTLLGVLIALAKPPAKVAWILLQCGVLLVGAAVLFLAFLGVVAATGVFMIVAVWMQVVVGAIADLLWPLQRGGYRLLTRGQFAAGMCAAGCVAAAAIVASLGTFQGVGGYLYAAMLLVVPAAPLAMIARYEGTTRRLRMGALACAMIGIGAWPVLSPRLTRNLDWYSQYSLRTVEVVVFPLAFLGLLFAITVLHVASAEWEDSR